MSQKLTTISPSYNSFVPDQVLTHKQLNGVIDYFEDQNRMSRLRLSGSGIVCGFNLSLQVDNQANDPKLIRLTLSQGTGITTDGDLVYNKPIDTEGVYTTNCNPFQFTRFRVFDDSFVDYFKNRIDGYVDGTIIELLPKEDLTITDTTPEVSPFDYTTVPGGLSSYIFFIYLESYSKETGACTSTSCETQGSEFVQKVRYLLIKRTDAQKIIDKVGKVDQLYKDHKSYEGLQDGLQKLQVKRMIFHDGTAALPADNSDQVKSYYEAAIHGGTTYSLLKSGLDTLCTKVGLPTVSTKINDVLGFTSSAIPADIQYRYDLFKDLVETYNEARDLIMHIDTVCCPLTESFPKHLMVGGFTSAPLGIESLETTIRHSFYESPLIGDDKRNFEKAVSLLKRAYTLATNYVSGIKGDEIKIVPSVLRGELGEKSIPFYYSHTQMLLNVWHFQKTYNRLQDTNLSYHTTLLEDIPAIKTPLSYNIDENDFYRIEGLQGKSVEEVKTFLETQRTIFGLDFDIVVADVANTEMTLTQLIQEKPSISHYAGVPRGGTFVIATQNDTVFADFAFEGKLILKEKVKDTGLGCCELVECTYPWISSLKYLNNLSRSLNGTQSKEQSMPKNYVLRVIKYEINDVSLKSGQSFEDIVIPMSQIFLRRMHAITEAMNTKYPKGLVFDFNESQKRFMITRPKHDKFVLEVQDMTLSSIGTGSLQPKYTYSSSGMYRQPLRKIYGSDTTHRPFVMICRDLRNYNPSLYEALQATYAPVNKDDDNNGDYRYKWAEFYKLRDRLPENPVIRELKLNRFVKADTELPYTEQLGLFRVINDMNQADILVQEAKALELRQKSGGIVKRAAKVNPPIYALDGDWVNGTWVNSDMIRIWMEFSTTTGETPQTEAKQEIFNFVELKEYLHEDHPRDARIDRKATRMSFYITNREYHRGYDAVIKQYDDIVDFYFIGIPSGKNAIQLFGKEPTPPNPNDPAPVDPTPNDPAPVDPTPNDPAPIDPTPIDPTPNDPIPNDPGPIGVVNTKEPAGTTPTTTTGTPTGTVTNDPTATAATGTNIGMTATAVNTRVTVVDTKTSTEAIKPAAEMLTVPIETTATPVKNPTTSIQKDPTAGMKTVPTGSTIMDTTTPVENTAPTVENPVSRTTVTDAKIPTPPGVEPAAMTTKAPTPTATTVKNPTTVDPILDLKKTPTKTTATAAERKQALKEKAAAKRQAAKEKAAAAAAARKAKRK